MMDDPEDLDRFFQLAQEEVGVTAIMTHIAIVEWLAGESSNWMEHVSDEQYQG
jgi:hypothetical protein